MRRRDFNKALTFEYIKNINALYCKYNTNINLVIDMNQYVNKKLLKNYIDIMYHRALKQERSYDRSK